MESKKPNFKSEFYEDAEDPLNGFRKQYGGARFKKKGGDPFAKDPDVVQSQRQEKLTKKISEMDTLNSGW